MNRKLLNPPRGRPYQDFVAEVARAFDPGAEVSSGEWMAGPDGRLDMDVAIRAEINGKPVLVMIECKDFNKDSTGKVGREFVDALDSKRHDTEATIAMICSNSGFTRDALSKAARKGIGMISVLKKGDARARVEIHEEIYLRRIRFHQWRFTYEDVGDRPDCCKIHALKFEGGSLDLWLEYQALQHVVLHPADGSPQELRFKFKDLTPFSLGQEIVHLGGARVGFDFTVQWLSQIVRLDAGIGLYDYLRRRMRLAPGENQYLIEGINWDTAVPCSPPPLEAIRRRKLIRGEKEIAIVTSEGIDYGDDVKAAELSPCLLETLTQ